jgi:beta-aspartyl-dipeptidase (metallo-type)
MITVLRNGTVYAPRALGRQSVLLTDGKVGKIGEVDERAVEALGVDFEIVDVEGCVVAPGLIDPHIHLLGGSGEQGFSTQSPEFFLSEIVRAGITTVVGTLGVDTTMKTLPGLLAKVKALKEEGLNAFMWTGGYNVPPQTILGSAREDIMFLDEVIGVGEIAISDKRASAPEMRELAKVISDAYIGGMLAKKAGVAHFHVGDGGRRLQPIRELLQDYYAEPSWLYLTHVERSEELMREAIDLANLGVAVDIDVVEEDLAKWVKFYLEGGGDPLQLTVSSDASESSPGALLEQLRDCVLEQGMPLERLLGFLTSNTARILKLEETGTLEKGKLGDLLVMESDTLEIVHVLSKGEFMVRNGRLAKSESFLEDSKREIRLHGRKGRNDDDT